MSRRGGLKSNPLALLEEEEREEAATVAAAQAAGAAIHDLPINIVAPDPENPAARLNPDPSFVASIKAEGQLEPGVVVSLSTWTSFGNDATGFPDNTEYVIVYGHRRWSGCRDAGKATYRAVITDTLKDNITKRVHRLIENMQREDLTPLDEATEYQRLMKQDGLSQREISRRTGIPQPHISKRVGLLTLPEPARNALSEGVITVETAVEMAKFAKEPDRIARVLDFVLKQPDGTDDERARRVRLALEETRREYNAYQAAKARADKRKALAGEGITVIEDLGDYFADKPHNRFRYQLHGDEAIQTAREAGTAVAYVYSGDHVEWYSTQEPEEHEAPEEPEVDEPEANADERQPGGIPAPRNNGSAPTVPRETDEQRERRERREQEQREQAAAAEARGAACARIAAKAPSREALTFRLARRLLLCEDVDDLDAQRLALTWLQAAGVVEETVTVPTLFGPDVSLDNKTAARVAYVYDLALSEARARVSADYDAEDAQHVARLTKEAGYEPAGWEKPTLDALIADTN